MKSFFALAIAVLAMGCGDDNVLGGGAAGGNGPQGGEGQGGAPTAGNGAGGNGGGAETSDLDDLLARLRADRDGTLLEESSTHGWPVLVAEGRVVVSADPDVTMLAGDFNGWVAEAMTSDDGFAWMIVPDAAGQKYKLTNGTDYAADPWSRGYGYDDFGEISETPGSNQLQRFFRVGEGQSSLEPRMVRVFVPEGAPTHVLYLHDGQNLFDPEAIWGGWHLQDDVPPGVMLVGIDNTAARMDEYTQVADDIGDGAIGGLGDEYADYVEEVVRPLIGDVYGEAAVVGVMGSSLGGLISLHIGERNPNGYAFVGSMSGTLGWGSIGPHTGETLIERYAAEPAVLPFVVYLDSGGDGPCSDDDADGIQDDGAGSDNYCETAQMRDTLEAAGYGFDENLFHWHEPGAEHNEQAWGARVFRPLEIFAAL